METRFYQAQGLDIERIAIELERMFLVQGYQVQHFGDRNSMTVQFKKGGDFAAVVGMQAALTLTLQSSSGGVMAVLGQQKWADKAAAGVVGMLVLWPLAFTAGAGAIRQSNLTSQLLNALDSLVRQQNASAQIGPVPLQMLPPQIQQQLAATPQQAYPPHTPPPPQTPPSPHTPIPPQAQWAPPPPLPGHPGPGVAQPMPAPAKISCPHCSAPNDAGDSFCARCGKPLVVQAPKSTCPRCGAPIKPDAAFCTKCGASFAPEKPQTEPTVAVGVTPKTQLASSSPSTWGYLIFNDGQQVELAGSPLSIGRAIPESSDVKPDLNLYTAPESGTVSRVHAIIERTSNGGYTLTDLKSTNLTRVNGQTLAPNIPVPLENGYTCEFGKVKCTFKTV